MRMGSHPRLVPLCSPLLRDSRLLSLPPPTEMLPLSGLSGLQWCATNRCCFVVCGGGTQIIPLDVHHQPPSIHPKTPIVFLHSSLPTHSASGGGHSHNHSRSVVRPELPQATPRHLHSARPRLKHRDPRAISVLAPAVLVECAKPSKAMVYQLQ